MKRLICILLSVTMLLSIGSTYVFAEEAEKLKYEFSKLPTYTDGTWSFWHAPLARELVSEEEQFTITAAGDGSWQYTLSDGSWGKCLGDSLKTGFVRLRPNLKLNGYRFTAPKDGNFKYTIEARNVGEPATARYGGDGVSAKLQVLAPGDEIDLTSVGMVSLPASQANPPTVTGTGVIKLKTGDSLTLWLDTKKNPNWDVLEFKFTLEETDEEGIEWVNREYEPLLPTPSEEQLVKAEPYRDNLFWVNRLSDGNPAQLQEAYELWSKYMPNRFGVITENNIDKNGNQEAMAKFYSEHNIPAHHHSMGNWDTHRYFELYDALETNWTGESQSTLLPYHDSAKPHEKFTHVFNTITKACINAGWGGSGVVDYIWDWSQGRGLTGFHPQTIAQFRKDLKEEDEGITITLPEGTKTIHFWDYAEYYTGTRLEPAQLGFESWDEYTSLTQEEYLKNPNEDYSPINIIHDLLAHYELMRVCQSMCAYAEDLGGIFQNLINPEDMANGTDSLFFGGLDNLTMLTDEFFNDAHLLDGAYYHYSYLHDFEGDVKRVGGVLEGGGGGQQESYWDQEVCYAMAYELTLAAELHHIEGDYWPGLYNLDTMKGLLGTDLEWQTHRAQDMFSYARGFADASDDNLKRLEPDFLSITSRRVLRPWGLQYNPIWGTGNWAYHTRWPYTPEHVLGKKGFVFRGIGEDGVERYLNDNVKVISYSPDRPMRTKFDYVLEKVNDGVVENMITPAGSLREIMDTDLHMKKMSEVYPEFAGTPSNITVSGDLLDAAGNVVKADIADAKIEIYSMTDSRWTPVYTVGGIPVVVESQYGNGKIYLVLFDPWKTETYDLTGEVYTQLLGKYGVKAHWETLEASGEVVDETITMTQNALNDLEAFESEASVRMYTSEDGMVVAGIQHPLVRSRLSSSKNKTGYESPYRIDGTTKVKVLMEPDTEYEYVAMPSGVRGRGTSDSNGMLTLQFDDTTHEIFHILPSSEENVTRLSKILRRRHIYYDALNFDGRLELPDETAPVTVPEVNGNTVKLTAEDNQCGEGLEKLEYTVNDGKTVTVTNKSAINEHSLSTTVYLSEGENTVRFKATDKAGNVESEGVVTVFSQGR